MQIHELTLATAVPDEMKKFYSEALGFPEIESPGGSDGFSFRAGYTRFNFIPGDKDARYHFAFNVKPDQLEDALKWIEQSGMDLLPDPDGHGKIVDFPAWKARSIYFIDPAGNIVEVIARAALGRAGNAPKFSAKSVLGVSEIGLVCEDVAAMREWIQTTHGVGGFARQENTDTFSAMGDDEGLLLLVPRDRPWFMGNFDAHHFPTALQGVQDGKNVKLILP